MHSLNLLLRALAACTDTECRLLPVAPSGQQLPAPLVAAPAHFDPQILINAGAIAPLHKACVDRSLIHCPHLRSLPDIDVRPFPAQWVVTPLEVEAVVNDAPQLFLAKPALTARRLTVVSFLQLCGVTEARDPAWRDQLKV